jgi:hypothetical protein
MDVQTDQQIDNQIVDIEEEISEDISIESLIEDFTNLSYDFEQFDGANHDDLNQLVDNLGNYTNSMQAFIDSFEGDQTSELYYLMGILNHDTTHLLNLANIGLLNKQVELIYGGAISEDQEKVFENFKFFIDSTINFMKVISDLAELKPEKHYKSIDMSHLIGTFGRDPEFMAKIINYDDIQIRNLTELMIIHTLVLNGIQAAEAIEDDDYNPQITVKLNEHDGIRNFSIIDNVPKEFPQRNIEEATAEYDKGKLEENIFAPGKQLKGGTRIAGELLGKISAQTGNSQIGIEFSNRTGDLKSVSINLPANFTLGAYLAQPE